jgi:hypothetical protein
MNRSKIHQFAELTKRQLNGDPAARDVLSGMKPILADGYCLFNAYEQWQGAFSFIPGREEALPVIASLAEKVARYSADDTSQMFAEPEWKEIVALRGPFDCAINFVCGECGYRYVGFGQSGFDDRVAAVCDACGDVWLQSTYDDEAFPTCECGGSFRPSGCPRCRSVQPHSESCFSSYEYFKNHKWKEKGPTRR